MPSHPAEYKCKECGHDFNRLPGSNEVCCPRCQSTLVERTLLLFGSINPEELAPEDYFDACLTV